MFLLEHVSIVQDADSLAERAIWGVSRLRSGIVKMGGATSSHDALGPARQAAASAGRDCHRLFELGPIWPWRVGMAPALLPRIGRLERFGGNSAEGPK